MRQQQSTFMWSFLCMCVSVYESQSRLVRFCFELSFTELLFLCGSLCLLRGSSHKADAICHMKSVIQIFEPIKGAGCWVGS